MSVKPGLSHRVPGIPKLYLLVGRDKRRFFKMKFLLDKKNRCKRVIFGFALGVIFASLMCAIIFLFEKGWIENLFSYYILIFLNGVPFVALVKLNLPTQFIYPLVFVYFVTLNLILVSVNQNRKYWFLIIIFLIHIIFAVYYNMYLNNLIDPLNKVMEMLF